MDSIEQDWFKVTAEACRILRDARIAACSAGSDAAWLFVAHAEERLQKEQEAYLRGDDAFAAPATADATRTK